MRDKDLRLALTSRLDAEHASDPTTRVVPELDLCGQVRVDLAVINGSLAGFELKSDRDTLKRLPHQVVMYGQVLDRATLVVGERHHQNAIRELPDWWGVVVAAWDGEGVSLHEERSGQVNTEVQPHALVQLLWRDEVLSELEGRGLDRGIRSKPRQVLWQRLADQVPLTELRHLVREQLKAREGWRSPLPTG